MQNIDCTVTCTSSCWGLIIIFQPMSQLLWKWVQLVDYWLKTLRMFLSACISVIHINYLWHFSGGACISGSKLLDFCYFNRWWMSHHSSRIFFPQFFAIQLFYVATSSLEHWLKVFEQIMSHTLAGWMRRHVNPECILYVNKNLATTAGSQKSSFHTPKAKHGPRSLRSKPQH